MVGVGVVDSSNIWARSSICTKQINIYTISSSAHVSHPQNINNSNQTNHTSLVPLTINPQWAPFPVLSLPPSPLEGVTRIWLPVFLTLLLTLIHFVLSLHLIDIKLQRSSKSQELPQLKQTRHSQPIRLLSQLQPGR